jgi:hypothetical protein
MKIIITKRQLVAEMVHYGPAFNKNNYLAIKPDKNLNEAGAAALFLSLPAIIKLFRFAIDKGQEYWIKIVNEELYKKIDKRTFASLLDENSVEDIAADLKEDQAVKVKGLIKVIKKITGAYAKIDKQSGVKTPHLHRSSDEEKARALRLSEETPLNKLQLFSEVLGAVQHGLHHLYSSAFNLMGSMITGNLPGSYNISDERHSKIADLIGNLLFVVLIGYLLLGNGIHVGSTTEVGMSAVKCLEIFVEGLECWEIVAASAVIVPSALKVIKEVLSFLKDKTTKVIDGAINSIFGKKIIQLHKFFKSQSSETNTLHSSRFSPEMLRTKTKKSNKHKQDYYGRPIMDSYIRYYLQLFLS